MSEEWEIFPGIPGPYYPNRFDGEVWGTKRDGTFGLLSPEELAAENKRMDELCEETRKDYERRYEEARRQWPRRRVELLKTRIRFLRRCIRRPGAERPRSMPGCVYLMCCPTLAAYKIGRTRSLLKRIAKLRQQLDSQIECRVAYRTPVFLPLLEKALHHHFLHCHFPWETSDELFKLAQDEVDGFEATTAAIERHLLAVEILRLKARLTRFEAERQEAE